MHISAHGLYRAEINGVRLSEQLLTPECSPYENLLMFQSYDVTELLQAGENIIGFELADGWWSGRLGLGSWSCCYGTKKELFMECDVTYKDGTEVHYGGEGAKSKKGATLYADLYVGEKFNAGLYPEGWSCPGYNEEGWNEVVPLKLPLNNLHPQIGSGVKFIKKIRPEKLITTPNGDMVLDFGQNIAGFTGFQLECEAGHEIILEHSEMLQADGNFFQNIQGCNKDQRDVYITRKGIQSWRPEFTYHGFRYVRISGWPGMPEKNSFYGYVISTEIEDAGDFVCSDDELNQLQSNIKWSQIANTISIPTDCPQREKAGWTGDIMIYAPTMLYLSAAENFLRRWLLYLRKEQFPNGLVPSVVPYWKVCKKMSEILGSDTSCGWGDAVVLVPWAIYRETGNEEVLKENYAAMTSWMEYVRTEAENNVPDGYEKFEEKRKKRQKYLWNTGFHFGDWMIPSIMMAGGVPRDTAYATKEIFASAYYAYTIDTMSKIAAVLGLREEEASYQKQFEQIRNAFIEEYVDTDKMREREFQGVYVICLKFDLVTKKNRQIIVEKLCKMLEKNGYCLDTGFLSVPFLLDVLCENGRRDLAFKLLFQKKCPSWLYMVEKGATTIWESWDCISQDGNVGEYSYNHYAFGCVGDWIYREIAGIQLLKAGYEKVRIIPGADSGLKWVKAKHKTPYGELKVQWQKENERFKMSVRIPSGVLAEIILPDKNVKIVGSGKYDFECMC